MASMDDREFSIVSSAMDDCRRFKRGTSVRLLLLPARQADEAVGNPQTNAV
jgi:hypothetical protein